MSGPSQESALARAVRSAAVLAAVPSNAAVIQQRVSAEKVGDAVLHWLGADLFPGVKVRTQIASVRAPDMSSVFVCSFLWTENG